MNFHISDIKNLFINKGDIQDKILKIHKNYGVINSTTPSQSKINMRLCLYQTLARPIYIIVVRHGRWIEKWEHNIKKWNTINFNSWKYKDGIINRMRTCCMSYKSNLCPSIFDIMRRMGRNTYTSYAFQSKTRTLSSKRKRYLGHLKNYDWWRIQLWILWPNTCMEIMKMRNFIHLKLKSFWLWK